MTMSESKVKRAPLIVLEGIDGAGTTTQARRLSQHLRGGRYADAPEFGMASVPGVHMTCQPSAGPVGLLIREMLAGNHRVAVDRSGAAGDLPGAATESPSTETLATLFAADRYDHLQREVEPALARGEIVVSDRWYHSSFAYQGLDMEDVTWVRQFQWIHQLNHRVRTPDLTIFLRVDPEIALQRRMAAGRVIEMFDDLEIQRRIARRYEVSFGAMMLLRRDAASGTMTQDVVASRRVAAMQDPGIAIVDGDVNKDNVFRQVSALADRLMASWTSAPRDGST
jgi:dTMP kinase